MGRAPGCSCRDGSLGLGDEGAEIEGTAARENNIALGVARPLAGVAVPGQLDAVEVGIMQVDRHVGSVVVEAVDAPAAVEQALHGVAKVASSRIVNGEVIETSGATRGRRAIPALPGIETQVVVVAAGRKEGSLITQADDD